MMLVLTMRKMDIGEGGGEEEPPMAGKGIISFYLGVGETGVRGRGG